MVQHRRRGKLSNPLKVGILHILGSVKAAAGEQGILDAGGHDLPETHLQVKVVQTFQQAVRHIVGKVVQVFAVGFIDRAAGLLHELPADVRFPDHAIFPRQRFRNGVIVFFMQFPQIQHFRTAYRPGVAYVKDMLQIGPAAAVLVNQRNAL